MHCILNLSFVFSSEDLMGKYWSEIFLTNNNRINNFSLVFRIIIQTCSLKCKGIHRRDARTKLVIVNKKFKIQFNRACLDNRPAWCSVSNNIHFFLWAASYRKLRSVAYTYIQCNDYFKIRNILFLWFESILPWIIIPMLEKVLSLLKSD